MKPNGFEVFVGFCAIVAILCSGFFIIQFVLGHAFGGGYPLYADFASVSGLHIGDDVRIAGVKVGQVQSIKLSDYRARVTLEMEEGVAINHKATASIKTENLVGNRSISIEPGASGKALKPGDEIKETRPAQTFQDLIGQLVAGDVLGQ